MIYPDSSGTATPVSEGCRCNHFLLLGHPNIDRYHVLCRHQVPPQLQEDHLLSILVSRATTENLSIQLLKKILSRDQGQATCAQNQENDASPTASTGITFSSFPTFKQAEAVMIARALELSGNNQGLAARMLGITRQALNNRLRRKKSGV